MDASDCHKTRIVKHQFEDQEDDAGYEGSDAWAADAAFRRRRGGRRSQHSGRRGRRGWRLPWPPAVGRCLHRPPALSGKPGHWVLRSRLLRLMQIELVCLNLNRSDTWQQPDPAYLAAARPCLQASQQGNLK